MVRRVETLAMTVLGCVVWDAAAVAVVEAQHYVSSMAGGARSACKMILLDQQMKTCFVLTLLLSCVAGAQSPGTFTATGNMTTGRVQHTATLLLDGKVLIAGGEDGSSPFYSILSSAEIYDPATGTFAPTSNMTRARQEHSATLLPDGRVLIAGGFGPLVLLGHKIIFLL
jgi:hypothetical protein